MRKHTFLFIIFFIFQTSFDEILLYFKYNTFLPVCKHAIPNYFCSHFVFYVYLYSVAKPLFWLLKECIKKQRPQKKSTVFCGWGGRIRTFGMTESESVALPLGDTPMFVRFSLFLVGIDGFEPSEWRSQSPLPYLLAISHRHVPHSNSLIIIAHHFGKCNTFLCLFTKHLQRINIYGQNDVKPYDFVEKLLKMVKICDKMTIRAWLGTKNERS